MRFLVDTSPAKMETLACRDLVRGQLLTPLTKYSNYGGEFAIDNGAFSGFPADAFARLLQRELPRKERCLFVACPDVVGSGRRTLELWRRRYKWIRQWPAALVTQDGMEDLDIPWDEMAAVFIGGRDPWKDSQAVADIVRTAKTLGMHVHVGRVNTAKRYKHFAALGADTCDGSGIARYDHMLRDIEKAISGEDREPLFSAEAVA